MSRKIVQLGFGKMGKLVLDDLLKTAQFDQLIIADANPGFPEHQLSASNPLGYKFTWSIVDTMCSYSIPGRLLRNGNYIDVAADAMFTAPNFHSLHVEELGGPLAGRVLRGIAGLTGAVPLCS